jgi:hypothetical protein
MTSYICKTCGVQHAESQQPPEKCLICEDERQYVGWDGQQWTTLEEMKVAGYRNDIRQLEPGLTGVGITPSFSIGQRALLVQTQQGNVMWDCISYIDNESIAAVQALGGIRAIAVSHPHFYDSMVEWSHAFNGAVIHIPEADRQWVMRPDPAIRYWDGSPLEVLPGVTLIQCGGHFDGSAVLHWAAGAEGKGVLLVGDTITVVPDRRYVSFMYSYPNLIPLSVEAVQQVVDAVEPYQFDRVYGGWWGRDVMTGGKEAVRRSFQRYIQFINFTADCRSKHGTGDKRHARGCGP